MPTTSLLLRALALAAGVGVSLTLLAAPGQADPADQQRAAAADALEVVVEQFNDIREDLRDSRRHADSLGAQAASLERAMAEHQAAAADIAVRAYRSVGGQPATALAALLTADVTGGVTDPLLIMRQLTRDQRRVVAELASARDRIAAIRAATEALTARQSAQERRLAIRKRQIEAEIARLDRAATRADHDRQQPSGGPTTTARPPTLPAGAAATAVSFAYAQLGRPYRWGADGPDGYDCSGLTSAAWARAGVRLPHNAARQYRAVRHVSRAERRPGDLVFYYRDIHHVGLYVGDGNIIHAPRPGTRVRLDRADYQPVQGYGRPG